MLAALHTPQVHTFTPPPILVTRSEAEIKALAVARKTEPDPRIRLRMTLVLARCNGIPVGTTAGVEQVSRNTPALWVKRFNEDGLAGFYDRPRWIPPRKIPYGFIRQVLASPPRIEGYKHEGWTPKLLWHALKDHYATTYSKGHLSRILRQLNDRLIVPRTEHISANPVKQEEWKVTEGTPILRDHFDALYVEDETTARVGTIVKKVLAERGSKPVVRVKVGKYDQKVNVFISWRAKTGRVVVSLEDGLDAVPTKQHLRMLKRRHGKGPVHVLWDGSGAHLVPDVLRQAKKAGIHVHRFPPHSPKMNPVEYINKQLKRFLSLTIFADREELLAAIKQFFREHHYKFAYDLADFIAPKSVPIDAQS
jgi:transposase